MILKKTDHKQKSHSDKEEIFFQKVGTNNEKKKYHVYR